MIYLKKANLKDAKKEYELAQKIPAQENGYENKAYGASFEGITALLAMLNSCASGVTVVNIDNGFGAGYSASMINHIGG